MAKVLAVCLSEKSDEGQSAPGMRGIFSAVRALEDMCIVPPLVGAIHRRIAAGGTKPGAQDYATPEMLHHLWQRATSERDRAFVALVILSWLCFWRVGESASVRPFDLLEGGGVSFYRTKSCGPRGWHRRPLFKFGMAWASYLSEYCKPHDLPTDRPIFGRGEAVLEDYLTTLLHGSRWSGYAWHSLRRGGAASCWNQKPGLPYFKWWGGWACTGVAMRYATAFLDHGVLESLALPCPGTGVEEPPVVNCLSLWGSAMFGADAVEESMGFVGAILGPALPHPGAVAAEPHATVEGGDHGGPPGHESESSSTSSESSSSCESSDSDVRIIKPPVGKRPPTDPAFRIGAEERPAAPGHGGGGGQGDASVSGMYPHQQYGTRQTDAEFGVRASPVVLKGGGAGWPAGGSGRCPPGSPPPHPSAVYLGPAPRKLRLGRDHRLIDVPLAMRGRAKARSSRPRAFQQSSGGASATPNSSSSPFSCFSSCASRQLGSLLPRPPPPRSPPALVLARGGCAGGVAPVCPIHGGPGAVSALDRTLVVLPFGAHVEEVPYVSGEDV